MKRKLYFIVALASMSLTNSLAQFTTSIPNLEAYYPLDGNYSDSSTNNYDLGANTVITYGNDRFGGVNRCLLTGSGTRIYKSPMGNFPEFSFGFWVNPQTSSPAKQVLLSRTVYILNGTTGYIEGKGGVFELYAVAIDADSMTLNMSIHFGQSSQPAYTWEEMYTATKKISISDWSHVGLTYSSTSNTLKMYVNGVDAGVAIFSTPTNGYNSMVFSTANINGYNVLGDMIIGGTTMANWNGSSIDYVTAHLPFEGRIDDLYIFSRAISATEMQTVKEMQDPSTASVSEETNHLLKVYPNPTTDFMQVELTAENESAYSIYSADNREVMNGTLSTGNNSIDVQTLAAGTYFLKTTINGDVVTKKISKQ